MINPSELNDKLKVLSLTRQTNERGQSVSAVQTLFDSLRCKRKTQPTKKFIEANQQVIEHTLTFIVRKRNIDETMLIEYKGKRYEILNVHEFDTDPNFIEILTKESRGA